MTDINARLDYLNKTLSAIEHAWPTLAAEIQAMIDSLTLTLISANNEETRGAIKALREFLKLPEALHSEREHISRELED